MFSTVRLLLSALLPILLAFLYSPFSLNGQLIPTPGHPLSALRRILLLTAHPDDECMFFAPTLLTLTSNPDVEVHSLCLSNGNQDGLGNVRETELRGSLDVLGIPEGKRQVLSHPYLQDNITVTWEASLVASVVQTYVVEHNIEMILTFDEQGISSHPNHISLAHGASVLLHGVSENDAQTLRVLTLTTVPLLSKYTGPLSALLAKSSALLLPLGSFRRSSHPSPVFVSGIPEYVKALEAMTHHQSQLVWFRWLYVSFSRYMWVNEWKELAPRLPANR